jgi:uncharacterized protein RhaS with RHS repeats
MGLCTQQDPIGIAGGLNLYGYANGDPVNFSDPFGLCPEEKPDCPLLSDAGQAATEFWAEIVNESDNLAVDLAAGAMGLLASLWTPDTAEETAKTIVLSSVGSVAQTASRFGAVRSAVNGTRIGSSSGLQVTVRMNPSERSLNVISGGRRIIDAGAHRIGNSPLGVGRQVPHLRLGQNAATHAPPVQLPFGIRFIR